MVGPTRSRFGACVFAKRRALALTQRDVADRAGCSISHVSEIERGSRVVSPDGDLFARLLNALSVSEPGERRRWTIAAIDDTQPVAAALIHDLLCQVTLLQGPPAP